MDNEIINKEIIIQGLSIIGGINKETKLPWAKIKIVDEHDNKYQVWKYKKDGEMTKAYTKLLTHSWFFSKPVGISYTEVNKEFTNREGKLIQYKERNIINFTPIEQNKEPEEKKKSEIDEINEEIAHHGKLDDINPEEIPF